MAPPVLLAIVVVASLALQTPQLSARRADGTEAATSAAQASGIRTIVLDPGHGGVRVGAIGPEDVFEKDLTLDVAERLRDLILRRLGLQVVLTRDGDEDISLDERTERANNWKADLFVSIHANAYRGRAVRGPETYFLSATATDELARRLADIENAETDGADTPAESEPPEQEVAAPDPELEFILWDLAQTQHLRESSMLAEQIQTNLIGLWGIRDRGVKQAPFRVLKGAGMPAVLVEIGYLSNREDAAMLASPEFRQRVAEALYDSINGFRRQYAVLVGANPD